MDFSARLFMIFLSDGDEGEVEMEDVYFSYPSRPNEDVLKVYLSVMLTLDFYARIKSE